MSPAQAHGLGCSVMYILTFAPLPGALTPETKQFLVSTLKDLDEHANRPGADPGLEKLKNAFGGAIGASQAAENGDSKATMFAALAGNEVVKACMDYHWEECDGVRLGDPGGLPEARTRLEKCGEELSR